MFLRLLTILEVNARNGKPAGLPALNGGFVSGVLIKPRFGRVVGMLLTWVAFFHFMTNPQLR